MMPTERREFLGLNFDTQTLTDVLDQLSSVTNSTPFSYIVTPNVDHLVRLYHSDETTKSLKPLYDGADLCLCDSRILHLLARARRVNLPVVPGSALTELMFESVIRPRDRVAVVGGDAKLLAGLKARYPGVEFVQHCPPMGLRTNRAARREAAQFLVQVRPRFAFIAVGSPQQEMIAAEAKTIPDATGTALCVGASLEFLTGQLKRAPKLAQHLNLEWAHRLLSEPSRMWRRYLVEGPRIFLLAYRWEPGDRGPAAGEL